MTANVIVPQVPTTMTISASSSGLQLSETIQLTATVRPAAGTVPPTGNVAFLLEGKLLGTGVLKVSAESPAAAATFTWRGSVLSAGDNLIGANYGGSSACVASTATVTITAHPSRIGLRLQ
jgi:hypothetical protein